MRAYVSMDGCMHVCTYACAHLCMYVLAWPCELYAHKHVCMPVHAERLTVDMLV